MPAPRNEEPRVDGDLVEVLPSLENAVYVRAVLHFRSRSELPCRVVRYTLIWDGGSVTAAPREFYLTVNQEAHRSIRVVPRQGDILALVRSQTGEVEVVAEHWVQS
jgi:hypothetical protein